MNTEKARSAWEEVAALQGWDSAGSIELGPHTAYQYRFDPKHLCFVLSRYKFCSKMLAGKRDVLEVGCGDAFGTPIVAQTVRHVLAIDWDSRLIASNQERLSFLRNCSFRQYDIAAAPLGEQFEGIYSVDVIEHIDPKAEQNFMRNCCRALTDTGLFIVGTPNVKAETYASACSKAGHINLKDASALHELLATYFHTVLLFSMNDEVVHTGFYNMGHYLFGVGIAPKREA